MHEMSIAQSLLDIIEEAIAKNGISRVTGVRMKIGELSAVVPDSLEFCFEVLARGTAAEGAVLEIETIPLTGNCTLCDHEFAIQNHVFECPECASGDVTVISGEELSLEELEGE